MVIKPENKCATLICMVRLKVLTLALSSNSNALRIYAVLLSVLKSWPIENQQAKTDPGYYFLSHNDA